MSDDLIERLRETAAHSRNVQPKMLAETFWSELAAEADEAADALAANAEQINGLIKASIISDELHAAKDTAISEMRAELTDLHRARALSQSADLGGRDGRR